MPACSAVLKGLSDLEELAENAIRRIGRSAELKMIGPKRVAEESLNGVKMNETLKNGVEIAAVSEIIESTG